MHYISGCQQCNLDILISENEIIELNLLTEDDVINFNFT